MKVMQVSVESAAGWTGQTEGYFCLACEGKENGWHFTGRICSRPRDAKQSFIKLCQKLGIPRNKYEFIQ